MEFKNVSKSQIYSVNGVEYKSLDEMPPEIRKFFEDRDGNGIPDIADDANTTSIVTSNSVSIESVNGQTKYRIGDRVYDSVNELPPEIRKMIADENGNGIPDVIEQHLGAGASVSTTTTSHSRPKPQPQFGNQITTDDGGGFPMMLVVAVLGAIIGAIGMSAYFWLSR